MTEQQPNGFAEAMALTHPIVAITNLQKSYTTGTVRTDVLKGIGMQIGAGEIVVILGPSGSGKSMLLIVGYLIGIPVLLASVTVFMQSLVESMQMTIAARLNGWSMLLGFVIVLLTYQVAKWLSKRKIGRIPMSEALKTGTE